MNLDTYIRGCQARGWQLALDKQGWLVITKGTTCQRLCRLEEGRTRAWQIVMDMELANKTD